MFLIVLNHLSNLYTPSLLEKKCEFFQPKLFLGLPSFIMTQGMSLLPLDNVSFSTDYEQ